jgi:hypothetical protein
MKNKLIIILLVLFSAPIFSQEYGEFRIGKEFNSIFQNLESGEFNGTVNGVLFIKLNDKNDLILDFQAGRADLKIVPDSNKVYDVSTKLYEGFTTSKRTKVSYSTYAGANQMTIQLPSGNFTAGSHDGASDMVINGIKYQYKAEQKSEYLSVIFNKDVTFDNFQWLRNKGYKPTQAKKMTKEIVVKTNSAIVFAIQRQ